MDVASQGLKRAAKHVFAKMLSEIMLAIRRPIPAGPEG
jgi:hypothetical protein